MIIGMIAYFDRFVTIFANINCRAGLVHAVAGDKSIVLAKRMVTASLKHRGIFFYYSQLLKRLIGIWWNLAVMYKKTGFFCLVFCLRRIVIVHLFMI
jgi:hypothetical protein